MAENLNKNVTLEGIFSVETPDTAGEILDVKGADISDLQSGNASLNTEHIAPSDAENSEMHKDEGGKESDDFKGFQSIIGRVINAKKIFSDSDCDSDRELAAWKKFQKPMIYGSVEIFDGEDAHPNARAAASIARMFHKAGAGPRISLSVEGATVKREGNLLKQTVIKHMAGTLKPANRAATIDIVKDDNTPSVAKSMSQKTTEGAFEPLRKSIAMSDMQYIPETIVLTGIDAIAAQFAGALQNLRKTLTAGGTNAAPGSLSGGSALQKEHQSPQLAKLLKLIGNKPIDMGAIKKAVPGISDKDAETVMKVIKHRQVRKTMEMAQDCYSQMIGKKS